MQNLRRLVAVVGALCLTCSAALAAEAPATAPKVPDNKIILTPKAPAEPRINGARVFGVRPGRPFLFTVPATGDRPMTFAAEGLPDGLKIDEKTGRITGKLDAAG